MLMIKRLMTRYLPGMLTCEEVDHFLFDFHEGQLSSLESLKFKLHLTMCSECQAYIKRYQYTVRIAKTGFVKAAPLEKVPEELMQVILKSRRQK